MGLENLKNKSPVYGNDVIVKPSELPEKKGISTEKIEKSDLTKFKLPVIEGWPPTTELKNHSWMDYYNSNHTSDSDDRLNIRYSDIEEPYIVTNIGDSENVNRIFVGSRGEKDAERLIKFNTGARSLFWNTTQFTFQFLNPRSHKIFKPSSVIGSGIPMLGTNIKVRMNRGKDTEGGSLLGISWPPSGGIYTETLDELTNGVGIYGNKFQVKTDSSKLMVSPVPYDNEFLPLPIPNKSILDNYALIETPVFSDEGGGGFGTKTHSEIPFISRRLTYKPTGQNRYTISKSLIPNSLFTLPSIENVNFAIPKYAGTDHFEESKKRFNGLANLVNIDYRFGDFKNITNHPFPSSNNTNMTYSELVQNRGVAKNVNTSIDSRIEKRTGLFGDFMTMATVGKTLKPNAQTLTDAYGDFAEDIESSKNGMPFYFKDLRDNTYIILRAYISGVTENVSPNWTEQNYIGRSEPHWIYDGGKRDIAFNLKLFANTSAELDMIYKKMNRLTSMCYPEYKQDVRLDSKIRMKPPFTQLRIGELYGSRNNDVYGFIKSLTYTFPDNSPWETKKGKRVPKSIEASISYQIIHKESASLRFAQKGSGEGVEFYGINTEIGVES